MLLLITSGQGPEECQLAVGMLARSLAAEYGIKVIGVQPGRYAECCKSVLAIAPDDAQIAEGTVQWIGKSPFRPKHKRQNWFVGVRILPEPPGSEYELTNGDVAIQTFRSGGAGGQHLNKTDSGVRAIHLPTGVSAVCTDERSQHLNKKAAVARLKAKLERIGKGEEDAFAEDVFLAHRRLERGNAVRVYAGTSFNRVK